MYGQANVADWTHCMAYSAWLCIAPGQPFCLTTHDQSQVHTCGHTFRPPVTLHSALARVHTHPHPHAGPSLLTGAAAHTRAFGHTSKIYCHAASTLVRRHTPRRTLPTYRCCSTYLSVVIDACSTGGCRMHAWPQRTPGRASTGTGLLAVCRQVPGGMGKSVKWDEASGSAVIGV
eukprot:95320-Chlamydomonas_euryale.AAC.3